MQSNSNQFVNRSAKGISSKNSGRQRTAGKGQRGFNCQ